MSIIKIPQPIRDAPVLEPGKLVFSQFWSGWFRSLYNAFNGNLGAGFTGTVVLAKLTPSTGTNGSLTVVKGIITAYTAPT